MTRPFFSTSHRNRDMVNVDIFHEPFRYAACHEAIFINPGQMERSQQERDRCRDAWHARGGRSRRQNA